MRTFNTAGLPHPQAEVVSIDAAAGVLVFNWLDVSGARVDSGGCVVRFTPVLQTPATDTDPAVYAIPDDAGLAGAIANPLPSTDAIVLSPLTVISRLTDAEKLAILTSTDPQVIVWRYTAVAAREVHSDDPRTVQGMALLVSKGLLAPNRPAELLAP